MLHPFASEEVARRVLQLPSSFQFFRWIQRSDHLHFGLFDRPDGPFDRALERMAETVLSHYPPDARRVMDVGCGIGGTACTIAKKGMHVVGMAPNEALIAYAKKLAEAEGCADRTEFYAVGFHDVPLEGVERFDVVMSQESMHYIHPTDATVRRFYEHLRPGGRLVLSDIVCHDDSLRAIAPYHDPKAIRQAARDVGFRLHHFEDLTTRALPTVARSLAILKSERERILAFFRQAQPHADHDFARLVDHGGLEGDALRDGRLGYQLFVYDKPTTA